jgi:hypothetical protein
MRRSWTRPRAIRYFAAVAAAVSAILYLLIGFEVIYIGEAASGGNPDLLAFGLMVGGISAVIAVLLAFIGRRLVWIPIALFNIAVIFGYFALAEAREPQFAPWGLVVKVMQLLVLGAVIYLVFRGSEPIADGGSQGSGLQTVTR